MTLPASGAMSLSANVQYEISQTTGSQISLGGSDVRTLYGVSSGAIRLAADGYGKTNAYKIVSLGGGSSRDVWCSYDGISFTKFTNALP